MIKKRKSFRNILNLSFQLAKINFKLRNEGSYLGILWYLLNPLLMFLILIFLRGVIIGGENINYPIYLIIGLVVFNLFSQSTTFSVSSVTNNGNLIKSMEIDKEIFVISKVFESVFSHIFEIILLIVFLVFYKTSLIGLFFYPFIFVLLMIFIFGLSFILATLGVFVNDLNNVWSILTRLLWFATPIFYTIKKGSGVYIFNLFNPFFYFISITRDIIIYQRIELWMVNMAVFFSLFTFLFGILIFERNKNKFAELL